MDRIFTMFAKGTIATVLIGGGIFYLVVLYDPPRTICDSQLEVFREAQKLFLFADKKGTGTAPETETQKLKLSTTNVALTQSPVGRVRVSVSPDVPGITWKISDDIVTFSQPLPVDTTVTLTYDVVVGSKFLKLIHNCRATNNPGGCYELFQEEKTLLHDLQAVPSDCIAEIGKIDEVRESLVQSIGLLVRAAWGEKPPATYYQKFGWLDTADLSLYCKLQQQIKETYGGSEFENFRERMFHELPGAETMSRNDVWDMTLFSENCGRYQ